MNSLFLRNLFFTLLQPGIVAVLIPFLILKVDPPQPYVSFEIYHFFGGLFFLVGLFVMLKCINRFASEGKGTLSPADPTKELVLGGLYRYSRNPMYVGVLLILLGEAFLFRQISLVAYALIVYAGFDLFIRLIEEPRLKKDFGEAYEMYCERVRRWV